MSTVAATSAITSSPAVIRLRRSGVSHDQQRVPSHERTPVAPAPTVMAPIMHWTHIAGGVWHRIQPGANI